MICPNRPNGFPRFASFSRLNAENPANLQRPKPALCQRRQRLAITSRTTGYGAARLTHPAGLASIVGPAGLGNVEGFGKAPRQARALRSMLGEPIGKPPGECHKRVAGRPPSVIDFRIGNRHAGRLIVKVDVGPHHGDVGPAIHPGRRVVAEPGRGAAGSHVIPLAPSFQPAATAWRNFQSAGPDHETTWQDQSVSLLQCVHDRFDRSRRSDAVVAGKRCDNASNVRVAAIGAKFDPSLRRIRWQPVKGQLAPPNVDDWDQPQHRRTLRHWLRGRNVGIAPIAKMVSVKRPTSPKP